MTKPKSKTPMSMKGKKPSDKNLIRKLRAEIRNMKKSVREAEPDSAKRLVRYGRWAV